MDDRDLMDVCRHADEAQRHAESLFRSAAIRHRQTGDIFEGETHAGAYEAAGLLGDLVRPLGDDRPSAYDQFEHGFMTADGAFVNRSEATQLAVENGAKTRGLMTSEALSRRKMMDRHALTGQSAVCDKRVGGPEDLDLDDVLELADRHDDSAIGDWSMGIRPDEIAGLDDELRSMPTVRRGVLYRGEQMESVPEEGSVHSWGRPVSASKSRDVPHDFIDVDSARDDWHPVVWTLHGGEGPDISRHPDHAYPDQHEVVVPAHHRFRVDSVRWVGKGIPGSRGGHWGVHATLINPSDDATDDRPPWLR